MQYNVKAEFIFTENCKKAYSLAFQLDYDIAYRIIEDEKLINPDNNLIAGIENSIGFLILIAEDDKGMYRNFNSKFKIRERKIKEDSASSPWKLYMLSEMYLQKAILEILNNQVLFGGYDFIQSFKYIKKNIEYYPDFQMNNKIIGIFNIAFDMIPSDFEWLAEFFGINGNYSLGIEQLQTFAQYSKTEKIFQVEAALFNFFSNRFLYDNYLDDKENYADIIELSSKNSLVKYLLSSSLLKNRKVGIAQEILFNSELKNDTKIFHMDYVKGLCMLYNNDDEVIYYMNKFIANYKGRYKVNHAQQKLSWYYYVNQDYSNYESIRKNILNNDNNVLEVDKQAYYEAKFKQQNLVLLKTRILFDGEKYQEALNLLNNNNNISSYSKEEYIEFKYRLARTNQLLDNYSAAISEFQFVILEGDKLNDYYKPFSYLQLGKIYKKINNSEKAEINFNKCLDASSNTYNLSLEFKAKNALERLRINN